MALSMKEGFAQAAQTYDAERRMLIACFDEFYGAACKAVGLESGEGAHILDLGAGTGLFSGMLAQQLPGARFTLIDLAGEMLEKAKARFSGLGVAEPELITGDYSEIALGGPYDAVISSLSIHHLSDDKKRDVVAAVFAALKPGGRFVNAEQILGDTDAIQADYDIWWESSARGLGATDDIISRARARMTHDKSVPVGAQLTWMEEAGFTEVSCVFQDHMYAVLAGRRDRG